MHDKPRSPSSDAVVLLHGMSRSHKSMLRLERYFKDAGYCVLNINYPSREHAIEDLVDLVHQDVKKLSQSVSGKIHFVGHSMGGLMIKAYIQKYRPKNLGRAVMLGTPNGGSELADILQDNYLFQKFHGPAGRQLTTNFNKSKQPFGPIDYEVGVIAGDKTVDPVSSFLLPNPNDGKVSVESTELAGMSDHIVMPVTHAFMMVNKDVINQVSHFIQKGQFKR